MGNGVDGVVEAVAVLPPVAEDLALLHQADHMLHPSRTLRCAALSLIHNRAATSLGRDHCRREKAHNGLTIIENLVRSSVRPMSPPSR